MAADGEMTNYEAARRSMVDRQVRPSDVTRPPLIDAMLWAPREKFLPKSRRPLAYMGESIDVGSGRFELDPRILAKMIEALAPSPDDLALVIGSGGGYVAAVLSKLCAAVVALDQDETLAASARDAWNECGVDTVISVVGPHGAGCAQHAPYNIVLVAGATPANGREPLADILRDQVAEGGRLCVLRQDGPAGWCDLVVRSGDGWSARRVFDASSPLLIGFEAETRFDF
ncbi:MAG: protein-L-isoaspartate O-methyltransferase [Pseudomonadota bacterium]